MALRAAVRSCRYIDSLATGRICRKLSNLTDVAKSVRIDRTLSRPTSCRPHSTLISRISSSGLLRSNNVSSAVVRRRQQPCGVPPRRGLFIQTEETPNPNSLKFLPGRTVLPEEHGSGLYCQKDDSETKRSPLAKRLFKDLEGMITGVFLGRDFITLTRSTKPKISWVALRPAAFCAIMDFFAEGHPVVINAPVASDTAAHEDDDEVVAMIKELLEEKIRPSVQDDGGDIFYKGFNAETGVVQVQLAGSCKGCPSSSVTLKSGVENMLMHYIPEVTGVEEVFNDELTKLNEKEVESFESKLARAGIPHAE